MKLRKDKWDHVEIGNIVSDLRNMSKNPVEEGYERYVGFEHIEPENIYLKRFGKLSDGISFKKTFQTNDVLFGKIRAYLKKVAVAPIDGICSGDILVLRTKDPKKLSQEILPYLLTTELFLKRAIDSSIGTTLPRTKWQHLLKHKVPLPSLTEQGEITSLFQAIENAAADVTLQEKRLKDLSLRIISDLTSESPQFGNLIDENKLMTHNIGAIAFDYAKREDNPRESKHQRYVGSDSISRFDFKVEKWQSNQDIISSMKVFEPNDYLLVRRSLYASDFRERAPRADFSGLCSGDILTIKENNKLVYDGYLLIVLNAPRLWEYIVANASGSITRRIKWEELSKFKIAIPDMETQKRIVEIFDQFQLTISQLKQQKISLKNLKQKLLNEILG